MSRRLLRLLTLASLLLPGVAAAAHVLGGPDTPSDVSGPDASGPGVPSPDVSGARRAGGRPADEAAARGGLAAPSATDSIWVFTNRADGGDGEPSGRGTVRHALRSFRVTPVRSDDVGFEVRLAVQPVAAQPVAREVMLSALREETRRHGGALVLHVHGYATGLDEAAEEAAEMRHRGGYGGPMAVFAWPSHPVGVTWPSGGRLVSSAYWQDSVAAAASAADLAAVLRDVAEAVGAERVVVTAHSMGNQLLAATLARPEVRDLLEPSPLRAIAFVAPDVDRTHFRDRVLPAARSLASRRVLYGARDDLMLRLSAVVHEGRARAGLFGPAGDWPHGLSGVEVVDITEGRAAAPWLGPLFDTNHAWRRQGTALADLFGVVASGAAAASRCALGTMAIDEQGIWRALDAPPPGRPWLNGGRRDVAAARATRPAGRSLAVAGTGPSADESLGLATGSGAPAVSAAASPACAAPRG